MSPQKVIIADSLEQTLTQAVGECEHDRTFLLADETTQKACVPLIADFDCLKGAQTIIIGATDTHKTLESLAHVWEELGKGGATRHTLLINIGGGMVTDLGGFAASTFKRGINYINIPTTLLSMVDASVGGKTGFNYGGLKNEIGVFSNARSVILDTIFLRTLDRENIYSGYAEMLKHALINNEQMWAQLLNFDLASLGNSENSEYSENSDYSEYSENSEKSAPSPLKLLSAMLADSVAVKQRIVMEDPTEQGIRKALNLGHTAGHAFESLALERKPVLHGYAVAWGLIVELYLSCIKTGFPTDKMRQTVSFIREHYGRMAISCDDYPRLIELMHHDKKNVGNTINFTLLGNIGDIRINQHATEEEIKEAFDFYREG
jgi:3-dehydroquinate synthase